MSESGRLPDRREQDPPARSRSHSPAGQNQFQPRPDRLDSPPARGGPTGRTGIEFIAPALLAFARIAPPTQRFQPPRMARFQIISPLVRRSPHGAPARLGLESEPRADRRDTLSARLAERGRQRSGRPRRSLSSLGTDSQTSSPKRARTDDPVRETEEFADNLTSPNSFLTRTLRRELGIGDGLFEGNVELEETIPKGTPDSFIHYSHRAFSGQFSHRGQYFFTTNEDMSVRLYDTSDPYRWKFVKKTEPVSGGWMLTDIDISHDEQWLAYSATDSVVYLAPTGGTSSLPIPMDIASNRSAESRWISPMAIWSLKFSSDDRQLLVGSSQSTISIYDIETRQTKLSFLGHANDVNSVGYWGPSDPHLLYSASDDTTIKIWDERALQRPRPVGVFLGHTEGVTHAEAHPLGRYLISNGKDQRAKLWDIRSSRDASVLSDMIPNRLSVSNFDYRQWYSRMPNFPAHPLDSSIQTFSGHEVLATLIRCRFSPVGSSTGGYVYSGGYGGQVHIWNRDGSVAQVLDTTSHTRDHHLQQNYWLDPGDGWDPKSSRGPLTSWVATVRDVSWHPEAPVLAATGWNGDKGTVGSTITYSWKPGQQEGFVSKPTSLEGSTEISIDCGFGPPPPPLMLDEYCR